MKQYTLILFCSMIFFSSCVIQKANSSKSSKQILILSTEKSNCDSNHVEAKCYQVKWTENQENWERFYNEIDGFTSEPGHIYKLLVSIEYLDNPLADATTSKYSLIRVLKKEAVCKNPVTKSDVLLLLKEKDLLLFPNGVSKSEIATTPSYQPNAIFDPTDCTWTVSSSTYKSVTYEGECAKTNGCTPEIRLTVKVNAKNLSIIDQKEERILHRNYE